VDENKNAAPARIGPNAILKVIEALEAGPHAALTRQVCDRAGLAHYLDELPTAMVDEGEVTALHRALRDVLGIERARAIGRDAGRRTGDYLLANRIPPFAQRILRGLPAPLAGRLLLRAITRNAWTFAGSGRFTTAPGRPNRLSIAGCRLCAGEESAEALCDFYGATFERLFQKLMTARARVSEVECQAQGHPACVFEVCEE
jgi:divinyl protochlorophyllide a 8-vinyl-reductase